MTSPQPSLRSVPAALARLIRARPADVGFVVLVIAGCLSIFYLGRLSTFRLDDWVLITQRPPYALDYLMVPHNEHWSFFMKLAFQATFEVVGMRSYLPYLALLVLAHGASVLAVYGAVSAAGGRILGFSVGTVMLFLGSAHENLFWYAAIGGLMSLAAGAAATWLLLWKPVSTRVSLAVAVLLVLSLMGSGGGLAFVAGLGVAVILDPARRAGWWAPVAAGVVYLVWHVIWGRAAGVTVDSVIAAPPFMLAGAASAFGRLTGLGPDIGGVVVILAVGAMWISLAMGRRPAFAAMAGTAGLLAFLGTTALVRDLGPLGPDMARAPRYLSISVACIGIATAGLLGRPIHRGAAALRALAIAPLLGLALISNGAALVEAAGTYAGHATDVRATLQVVGRYPDAPAILNSQALGVPMSDLQTLITRYGSPTTDQIRPTVVLPVEADALDRALFGLVKADLTLVPDPGAGDTAGLQPPAVVDRHQVAEAVHGCLEVKPLGADAQVSFGIPSGSTLLLETDGWGDLGVYLAQEAPFQEDAAIHQQILAGTPYLITVPDMGDGFAWRLNLKLGSGIHAATICSP